MDNTPTGEIVACMCQRCRKVQSVRMDGLRNCGCGSHRFTVTLFDVRMREIFAPLRFGQDDRRFLRSLRIAAT